MNLHTSVRVTVWVLRTWHCVLHIWSRDLMADCWGFTELMTIQSSGWKLKTNTKNTRGNETCSYFCYCFLHQHRISRVLALHCTSACVCSRWQGYLIRCQAVYFWWTYSILTSAMTKWFKSWICSLRNSLIWMMRNIHMHAVSWYLLLATNWSVYLMIWPLTFSDIVYCNSLSLIVVRFSLCFL